MNLIAKTRSKGLILYNSKKFQVRVTRPPPPSYAGTSEVVRLIRYRIRVLVDVASEDYHA